MTKILVVDDDSAINELIKINLELQGYEVIQAYNGVEGFAKAKQEEPSLNSIMSVPSFVTTLISSNSS